LLLQLLTFIKLLLKLFARFRQLSLLVLQLLLKLLNGLLALGDLVLKILIDRVSVLVKLLLKPVFGRGQLSRQIFSLALKLVTASLEFFFSPLTLVKLLLKLRLVLSYSLLDLLTFGELFLKLPIGYVGFRNLPGE
jgi:hypothetical protein